VLKCNTFRSVHSKNAANIIDNPSLNGMAIQMVNPPIAIGRNDKIKIGNMMVLNVARTVPLIPSFNATKIAVTMVPTPYSR